MDPLGSMLTRQSARTVLCRAAAYLDPLRNPFRLWVSMRDNRAWLMRDIGFYTGIILLECNITGLSCVNKVSVESPCDFANVLD